MFKSGRWRSKNKFKSVFMLQFQATEVPRSKKSGVSIALVPEDVGKPTVKLDKAPILEGSCTWEDPIYETVKLIRDPKTGKIKEKIYHFIVSTGSSKSGFLGEASIDFADFAFETEALTVSLPLKFANSGAVLHVTILKMEGPEDQKDVEENETVTVEHESSLKHQLSNCTSDDNYDFTQEELFNNIASQNTENCTYRASSATLALSWDIRDNLVPQKGAIDTNISKRSNTDWSLGSASDGSLVDSSNGLEDNAAREGLQEVSDDSVAKLKGEIAMLTRQASVSELELQTLRRQIVKETKRGQTLSSEIGSLRDERDSLKRECERLKSLKKCNDERVRSQLKSENQDLKDLLGEMKKELDHEEDLNGNLRMQIQKTQDSNSELILEVRELNEMLERKNKEIDCLTKEIEMSRNLEEVHATYCKCNKKKDEYQETADDNEEMDILKQKITDLAGQIEVYRKHKDNLAIYVEQLTVENETLKQEYHEITSKLEQKQQAEAVQSESSGSEATQHELESQVERLEEQTERQAQQLSEYMLSINELKSEVKDLEKELEKQAQRFEDELDATTRAKVVQEQRAIRAEEALRKARSKALAESSEVHRQKKILEEMLQKANQELGRVKDQNEEQLQELSNQIDSKVREIDQMSLELDDKSKQLEYAKMQEREKHEAFSMEIQALRTQIERLKLDKYESSKKDEKLKMRGETEETKASTSEAELLKQKWNREREDLEKKFSSARIEAEKLEEELMNMRSNKDENERLIRKLQSEKQNIRTQNSRLKDRLHEEDLDKQNMMKQVIQLKDELRKKESEIVRIENTFKDNSMQIAASEASLKNKLKLLEEEVKLKEAAPETARSSYLEKETNLSNTIKKLENKMEKLKLSPKEAGCVETSIDSKGQCVLHNSEMSTAADMSAQNERKVQQKVSTVHYVDECNISELVTELTVIKERNKSMEIELKEMQERYTEISLKFAEVEGERQQLVMTVRNLKNGKKN